MEERRFDDLTRSLGAVTSRRQVWKGLLAATVGGMLAAAGIRAPRAVRAATPNCNDAPYGPSAQCCEPSGVQPRYPIADLDLCPNRVPHPGHVPSFNGCGPAKGFVRHLIPNKIGTFRNIDFTPACNNHDVCYDTCNSAKSQCDKPSGQCACGEGVAFAVWCEGNLPPAGGIYGTPCSCGYWFG